MFDSCIAIENVNIPSNVDFTTYGAYAFANCTKIFSATILTSTTADHLFENDTTLTSVTFGDNIKNLNKYTFANCTSLTSVTFGENMELELIDSYAFKNCVKFQQFTVPDSTKMIGEGAFNGCIGLTEMTLPFVGQQVYTSTIASSKYTVFGWIFGTEENEGSTRFSSRYNDTATSLYTFYIPSLLVNVNI